MNTKQAKCQICDEIAEITNVDIWVGEARGSVIACEWVEDPTVDDLTVDVTVVCAAANYSVDSYFKNPVVLDAIKVGDAWFMRVEWFWSADLRGDE